jgi:hypothetical protein
MDVIDIDHFWIQCFSYLRPQDLLRIGTVSRLWRHLSNSSVVWDPLVEELWADKVYVSSLSLQLRETIPKLAYYFSITDSTRTFLTVDELCNSSWCFRFKEAAGEDWTLLCPWNQGGRAMRVKYFKENQRLRYEPSPLMPPEFEVMQEDLHIHWQLLWRSGNGRQTKKIFKKYLDSVNNFAKMASAFHDVDSFCGSSLSQGSTSTSSSSSSGSSPLPENILADYISSIERSRSTEDGSVGDSVLLRVSLFTTFRIARHAMRCCSGYRTGSTLYGISFSDR